jgi:hypothetical protein
MPSSIASAPCSTASERGGSSASGGRGDEPRPLSASPLAANALDGRAKERYAHARGPQGPRNAGHVVPRRCGIVAHVRRGLTDERCSVPELRDRWGKRSSLESFFRDRAPAAGARGPCAHRIRGNGCSPQSHARFRPPVVGADGRDMRTIRGTEPSPQSIVRAAGPCVRMVRGTLRSPRCDPLAERADRLRGGRSAHRILGTPASLEPGPARAMP